MKAVCIRQIAVDSVNTSIMCVCWYGRTNPDPQWYILKHCQSKSKVCHKLGNMFTKLLEYIEDPGNDQLAAIREVLKRLTPFTSIPNIALKTVNFYYP